MAPGESFESRNIQADENRTAPAKQARSKLVANGIFLNFSNIPT